MEPFSVHILGSGSARPTRQHKPSCQVASLRGKLFMFDCGEGAQFEFNRQGLSFNRLGHIFISHNHGDHVFGLPGLLSTMALLGRTADLHVYGPAQTGELIALTKKKYCEGIDYNILFHEVDTTASDVVYEDRSITVRTIPLQHRIPCCGYLLQEKAGLPHIRREMIDAFEIPVSQINNIKAGAGWTTKDGKELTHEMLTTPGSPSRSFAYCSDTMFIPGLSDMLTGVDLLFHEATFSEEMLAKARQTFHSTAAQAATVALKAQARRLCIGHYSARIQYENELLREAQEIFPDTILAKEGLVIHV